MLPKILIVDDVGTNLLLLRKILSKLDAELVTSMRPLHALELAEKEEYALMILDVMMPQMIGFNLAEKIRRSELNKITPIIFLTGIYSDNESIFKGYDSGAVDYITQPFRKKVLYSKVKVFLNLYNQRKELDDKTKRLEQMVEELKEAEKQIVKSLLEGEDRERHRIARELHDGMGQYLTAASLSLKYVEKDIDKLDEEHQEKFHSALLSIDNAIKESKVISHNLMPGEVKDLGLQVALNNLIQHINKSTELDIKFIQNLGKNRLAEQTELHLYRISQEFINNTLRHAGAHKVTLQIIIHPDEIIYSYEDDGKGIPKEILEQNEGISGLRHIQNRIKSLSGNIQIDTAPGKGMMAIIELPQDHGEK